MLSVAAAAVALVTACASAPESTTQLQIKDDTVRPKARTMYAAPGPGGEPAVPPEIARVAELPRS